MRNRFLFIGLMMVVAITFCKDVWAQSYNNNPKLSFINHEAVKTPESASFEKYGKIPVGEYTGTASVTVPLYTIKRKGIELPINLSYHASGIKVSQEATWVGLGWDLVPGGRITLEVKGGYDQYANQVVYSETQKNIVKYIFGLGNGGNPYSSPMTGVNRGFAPITLPIYSYHAGGARPFIVYGANVPTDKGFNRELDYFQFIRTAVEAGYGEPDIYHVNVLGKSFSFYKDLLTNELVIKGEQNLYTILEIPSSMSGSSGWLVRDDEGIQYHFEQVEETHYFTYIPGRQPIATAWLLTKVITATGEQITYTYENYGNEYPAPSISESEVMRYGAATTLGMDQMSSATNKNHMNDYQYTKPQYLTRIETPNARVDFILGTRSDIAGLGTRRLDKINVIDKLNHQQVKQVQFNYDYFTSIDNTFYIEPHLLTFPSHTNNTPEERMKSRLRLNSVDILGSDALAPPQTYRFKYNEWTLANKISGAQDHWGYYNGSLNNRTGVSITPSMQSLNNEGITGTNGSFSFLNNSNGVFVNHTVYLNTINNFGHANRAANALTLQAGMLNNVIYPTGGYTTFEYEPHRSLYEANFINGGGLRVKKVANFTAPNVLADVTLYEYNEELGESSGVYLGTLDYFNLRHYNDEYYIVHNQGEWNEWWEVKYYRSTSLTLLSNGNLSGDGPLIGYRRVTKRIIDYQKGEQYSIVKKFNANDPTRPLYLVTDIPNNQNLSLSQGMNYLRGAPRNDLDGLLLEEGYYDKDNQPVKLIKNSYTQHNLLDTIYSVKIVDNKMREDPLRPPDYLTPSNIYMVPGFFFEPVRRYRTTLDTITTISYENSLPVITKTEQTYNEFNQVETTVFHNSDGEKTAYYTTTPLSYKTLPPLPGLDYVTGNAESAQYLKMYGMPHKPIETAVFKRIGNVDYAVGGAYYVYDHYGNIKQTYQLETDVPLASFQKSTYHVNTSLDLQKDSHYKLKQEASYYPNTSLLMQLNDQGRDMSFVYDQVSQEMLASTTNAKHQDVAYTSFETAEWGNWQVNGGVVNTTSARTGNRSYDLGGGTLSKLVTTAGTYLVSYWSKNGSLQVNGASLPNAVSTVGDWNFYEHEVTLLANGSVTLSGTQIIDELRLYPKDGQLTSYTYQPLVGVGDITDVKNQSSYYSYDHLGRLKAIKDQNFDLVKSYQYHFMDNSTVVPTSVYFNEQLTANIPKACPPGQIGSTVPYTVRANKYMSLISPADANQQAQNEINTLGQQNANNLGTCTIPPARPTFTLDYSISAQSTFLITIYDSVSNQSEYYEVSGSGSLTDIPGGTGYISINEINYTGNYSFILDHNVTELGVYVQFGPITMNASTFLYIGDL